MSETLPLFPLSTVLFPEGPLKLRIFEPRYLDMIGRCLREDSAFGIALIVEGREAGGPARTTEIGTSARVVDFEQLDDGLLGITARGERRFRILSVRRQSDGLHLARVEWLPTEQPSAVPPRLQILAELMRQAYDQVAAHLAAQAGARTGPASRGGAQPRQDAMSGEGPLYGGVPPRFDDAGWIGMRLAEILPLAAPERQRCLEMLDPIERLTFLRERLDIRQQ